MDAVELFLLQHATLCSERVVASEGGFYVADGFFEALTPDELRWRPEGRNSIVWYLWHVTRCEDLAINTVVADRPQVLDGDGWLDRLRHPRRDVGIGMTKAEMAELSDAIAIEALRAYRDAVCTRTREVAAVADWRRAATAADVQRILDQEGLDPKQDWVLGRFEGKSAAWFFHWLAGGHVFWHLGQCRAIAGLAQARRPQ